MHFNKYYMMGVTSGTGTVDYFGAPYFNLDCFVLFVCFCGLFFFGGRGVMFLNLYIFSFLHYDEKRFKRSEMSMTSSWSNAK